MALHMLKIIKNFFIRLKHPCKSFMKSAFGKNLFILQDISQKLFKGYLKNKYICGFVEGKTYEELKMFCFECKIFQTFSIFGCPFVAGCLVL